MISESEILLRLALGALMGGVIGLERQIHGRPAGFRTHMLVSVAMVLLMIVSEYYHYLSYMDPGYVRVDPGRIAAGAITGIGFLGAGVIVKTGATVQGLTTAASIWMVSAIGLALGSGLYWAGAWAFGVTVFALLVLRVVETKMARITHLTLTLATDRELDEDAIAVLLRQHGALVKNTDYEADLVSGETTYRMTLAFRQRPTKRNELMKAVSAVEQVKKVSLKR